MPIIPDEEEFDARMPPWVPGQDELEYGLPEAMLLDDTQQTEMLDAPELASEPEPDDQQSPQGAGQAPANWPPSMRKFSASGRQIMGGQERKAARAANRPHRAAPAQPAPVPAPAPVQQPAPVLVPAPAMAPPPPPVQALPVAVAPQDDPFDWLPEADKSEEPARSTRRRGNRGRSTIGS